MKFCNLYIILFLIFHFSCTSSQEKNYFTLHKDSKTIDLKNETGLLIISLSNNPASIDMAEWIAEGLTKKSMFKIGGPINYNTKFPSIDNLVEVDTANNIHNTREHNTREGNMKISAVMEKFKSKFIFFTDVHVSTSSSENCLIFTKDVSIKFDGILINSDIEIIGTSSFKLTSVSILSANRETAKLLKEGSQLIVSEIIKKLGTK